MSEGGLERFGFVIPPSKARGPEKMSKNWLSVSRAGPNTFDVWTRLKTGDRSKRSVSMDAVQECWAAISWLVRSARANGHQATVDLTPRQIMAQLIARAPEGTPTANLSVDGATGGTNRAAFYFPRYYYPIVVLDLFYRAVERSGRSIRVVKEDLKW